MDTTRRRFLIGLGASGAALLLNSCASPDKSSAGKKLLIREDEDVEVTAVEDLMREHGILRRALFVYSEMAAGLRNEPSAIHFEALRNTAGLFRSFGEDYHEVRLEEAFIFPQLKRVGTQPANLTDVLISQHRRGRAITDYLLAVSQRRDLPANGVATLAKMLESFVRMYEIHMAIEDTNVFPAWKKSLSEEQLDEFGDKFEDIERGQLGNDGFENTLKKMADIEDSLGMADLAKFTAPHPPKV